ncbi:heparan-alpha-glucosaminide N-acetyltransferase domain-containing protein [Draconibacterium orientale]|uniref:acyltransferase family protein n=1 Tax=Draconibacterium orientale TaxID=1168034 RepID=UPI0029C0389E|nr:heparan-alpha-glucosaminide N-acetyltransferase domain-containing protein [Draconibacterium orientale]
MKTAKRYLALDVLRGLTIVAMITVNNPGSWSHIYQPLKHSAWNGCSPTDLVFPFFLFIVGVSMYFSFSKYGNTLNKESFKRLAKRTILIFAIGLFLNSFPQWARDFSKLRILGVLQRIAIVYGITSLIVLSARKSWLPYISATILLLYWGILYYFGNEAPFSLEGNATLLFDRAILGESHMYHGFGIPFDPEGLLSTIPAIVTALLGYMAGALIHKSEETKIIKQLFAAGLTGIATGLIWGLIFPINKPLWTSSYVLYAAGWASVVLAGLIWIIDIKSYKKWTSFFVAFGMNPLFIFALSGLWANTLTRIIHVTNSDGQLTNGYTYLYHQIFVPLAGPLNGSLLFALAHVAFLWMIARILYKKKIFIKV